MRKKNKKNKKRNRDSLSVSSSPTTPNENSAKKDKPAISTSASKGDVVATKHHNNTNSKSHSRKIDNPLLVKQERYLKTLSHNDTTGFFSNTQISVERRAQLWMEQADLGETLVNQYSWATPNEQAIKILQAFSPIIEIGCGSNAYWSRIMKQAGIDVIGYDINLQHGGKTTPTSANSNAQNSNKKKKRKNSVGSSGDNGDVGDDGDDRNFIRHGGPEVLASREIRKSNRTLFLCYPDEDDFGNEYEGNHEGFQGLHPPQSPYDSPQEETAMQHPQSMGWQCLQHYTGTYVIHVGELIFESNLSIDQAPWGRSSSPEFQQRLASEYHCLLRAQLPNWLHVRDTISVWKRSETCTIVFAADDSDKDHDGNDDTDEDEEEVEYRHIPPEEQLPTNVAAPCLQHLLLDTGNRGRSHDSNNHEKNGKVKDEMKHHEINSSEEEHKEKGKPTATVENETNDDEMTPPSERKKKKNKKKRAKRDNSDHNGEDKGSSDKKQSRHGQTRNPEENEKDYSCPW